MRLAVAIDWFDAPNGAATYAHALMCQLLRLGHEAALTTCHPGEMAMLARAGGIPVVEGGGPAPDVVIAQDPMIAAHLAELWPRTPQVYVAHGPDVDQGQPPLLGGVTAAIVAMNDRVAERARAHASGAPVVRLRQPIDTDRFRPRGPIATRPRRALLLGNYLAGAQRELVKAACRSAGIETLSVGAAGGHVVAPDDAFARVDIVIGYGRAILEGMACARAAYVLEAVGSDGWVTPDRYATLEADGFAGSGFGGDFGPGALQRELRAYEPAMGEANRSLIRAHHRATGHAAALVAVCLDAAGSPRSAIPAGSAAIERAHWHAEWRQREANARALAADERAADLERRLVEAEAVKATRRYRVTAALCRPLDRLRGR